MPCGRRLQCLRVPRPGQRLFRRWDSSDDTDEREADKMYGMKKENHREMNLCLVGLSPRQFSTFTRLLKYVAKT